MEIKRNHIINEKTTLFYGVLYKNGELFTKVIEGDEMFLVAMTPLQFINQSLIKYGSDLKGALNSSKKLLGKNQKKYPIKISSSLDIYLFPTKSIKREDCVWFALSHVKVSRAMGVKYTNVFLNDGHMITIEMKESSFRNKWKDTQDLRDMIIYNKQHSLNILVDHKKGIHIMEVKGKYRCRMPKENKKVQENKNNL
ncbi:competence protein ComK [Neobacillus mesonae]|uniref:competence protein ComK n=1 Tax=Neobacillus mesonae TaxID=1193713 RepID=UPI00082D86DD|nr:competence protein ComK [Neobacillus mesonae]